MDTKLTNIDNITLDWIQKIVDNPHIIKEADNLTKYAIAKCCLIDDITDKDQLDDAIRKIKETNAYKYFVSPKTYLFSNYLKKIAEQYSDWYFSPELRDILTEVGIKTQPVEIDKFQFLREIKRILGQSTEKDWEPFFQVVNNLDNSLLLLKGTGGMGKTSCLKYLAWKNAINKRDDRDQPIPIYIELTTYGASNKDLEGLEYLVWNALKTNDVSIESSILKDFLKQHKFLFLFDGHNEIGGNKKVNFSNDIKIFIEGASEKSRFIITTRESDDFDNPNFKIYEFKQNDPVKIFLEQYLEKSEQEKFLEEISTYNFKVPLFIVFLIIIYKREGKLLKNKGRLIQKIIDYYIQLWEKHKKRQFERPLDWKEMKERFISTIAYYVLERDMGMSFKRKDTSEWIAPLLKEWEKTIGWDNRYDIENLYNQLCSHGFLIKNEDIYSFSLETFRDYFAACYLIEPSKEI